MPHAALWEKGKVFKRTNIRDDARLRSLLTAAASETPLECQSQLCAAGYHTTRMEIGNYRKRMALSKVVAPHEPEPQQLLLCDTIGSKSAFVNRLTE